MDDKSTVINISGSKCVIKKTVIRKLVENGEIQEIKTTIEEITGANIDTAQLLAKFDQLSADGLTVKFDENQNEITKDASVVKSGVKSVNSGQDVKPKISPEIKPESKPENKPENKAKVKAEDKPVTVQGIKDESVRTANESKDSGSTVKSESVDQFKQDCLSKHNQLRSLHAVEPLTINDKLNELAQDWANHLASIGSLSHRPKNEFGENVFWTSLTAVNGDKPVESWYSEISKYNWDKAAFVSGTGHFTQVVWKGSKEIGIGKAVGSKGTFIVCNYKPAGNFIGKFAENVLPLKK
ncbi:protein PRY2 [Tetranychus urticae]|uniref:SCP domain-containing protein n=1 Tax=Tetranychus urticae TaxID=32264 RepID=T1KTP0_TETUR|nr:protein PRY2 [Tetranychus urticae]